jgi:exoribonuclease R
MECRWVTPDSPLDLLARDRAQSLYLPNGVSLPLLPSKFSTEVASLRSNTQNYALTFAAKLDPGTLGVAPASVL